MEDAGVCKAGSKPSTWLPPEGLVEQVFSSALKAILLHPPSAGPGRPDMDMILDAEINFC